MTDARTFKHNWNRSGFTLVELLIAVSILVIITTLIYGSFTRSYDAREFVLAAQERFHTARLALYRMANEISMAFIYECREQNTPTGEPNLRTLFKLEHEGNVDRLLFASFSNLRLFRNVHESDQNVITYYGENDPQDSSKTNLLRKVKTHIDGNPEDGGKALLLCPDIEELSFELWDETKQEWVDEWDCSQVERLNQMPSLVRITLTVVDEYGKEMPFVTITRIFARKPLNNWMKPSQ